MEEKKAHDNTEIYSQRVRAGKRTYFFDVKATRSNDYYLTITESKRKFKDDGYFYEKHKIFLYKEDFNKFVDALNGTVGHVKSELLPEVDFSQFDKKDEEPKVEQEPKAAEQEPKVEVETDTALDDELTWD